MPHIENRATVIELAHLNKQFLSRGSQVKVLCDISLQIGTAEFVAFVGPSGCGKTTLLKIVAGLIPASTGQILVNGEPVLTPGADRGIVFQDFSLFPWLTVRQNIAFGLSLRNINRRAIQEKVDYYLSRFGLSKFESFYPAEISGGMQQRVAIARTLANDPRILLLDEPFGSLDAYTRTAMQDFLLDIVCDLDKTILFVTHDIAEAVYLADRVIVLSNSPARIITEIPVDLERPRSRSQIYGQQFQSLVKHIHDVAEQWQ